MDRVTIHASAAINWHQHGAEAFMAGLARLGIPAEVVSERQRVTGVAVLLGTTLWRDIEASGRFLLVDRASIGDPDYVQLVWDGHGRRGDHCVPADTANRYRQLGETLTPWHASGDRVILCGQCETYSPHWRRPEDWYKTVSATHFRPHPMGGRWNLPEAKGWLDARRVITLNSSVGVESVLAGIPTVTMDEGAMAWDVTSHDPAVAVVPNRMDWLRWLSWTQWHWQEIAQGEPIRHLFEGL